MKVFRIDFLLFGYRKITVKEGQRERAINRLMHFGLSSDMDNDGSFFIAQRSCARYKRALSGIDYEIGEVRGALGALIKYRYRFGIFSALFISIILFLFSSAVVFDVRVVGNEEISKYRIEEVLDEAGLSDGVLWSSFDKSEVERKILEASPEIAWVNINRRGTVAYVTVREKDSPIIEQTPVGAYNIVATEDGVIEEITVRQGIAAVKVGDTVKVGDLLISGVIPPELGGGFVRADGDVIARTERNISVKAYRTETVKEYISPTLVGLNIKILSFSVNIFKNYGNSGDECDIIKDKDKLMLPGGKTLPVSLTREYLAAYTEKTVSYDDAELVKIAEARLAARRISELSATELLRAKTSGGFFDGGYEMRCEMLVLTDIGRARLIG